MSNKLVVVVALAAVAPGAAHAADVDVLLKTATGSRRDFTADERRDAVSELARLAVDDDDAARALVSLLGSELDAAVLASLQGVGSASVTRALRQALDQVDVDDDKQAARAQQLCVLLAGAGDAAVVASITRIVDDGGTKELRVACLRSLARLHDVDAATRALVRYVDHHALGLSAREVLLRMSASVALLKPLLHHNDPAVRAFATRALGGAKDDDVADALVRQLRDAVDDKERGRVIRGLKTALCGDGGDRDPCGDEQQAQRLVDVVAPFLMHKDLADAAVSALARVRLKTVVKPLIDALDHPSSSVRTRSAELLGRVGDVDAKPALRSKLERTLLTNNWSELDALMHAFVALGIVVDDAPFLATFLGRSDIAPTSFAGNHQGLWLALAKLAPSTSKVFIPLLRNESRAVKRAIAVLLGQLGDPDSGVALLDVVEKNDDVSDDAARALGACADRQSLPRMQKLLEQRLAKEPWSGGGELALAFVRGDRAYGLERTLSIIGKQGPLAPELLRALLKETHPSDARAFAHAFAQTNPDASTTYTFRWLAILGWAQIDTPHSVDTLCQAATTHPDDGVRRLAATSLRRFPEPRAVACMVTALAGAGDNKSDIVRALEEATGQSLGDDVKAWQVFVDGGVGLRGGEAALIKALNHPDGIGAASSVRMLAARQLAHHKQGLAALLAALPAEGDPDARLEILRALAAHDVDAIKRPLVDELERKRSTWPERVVLARALDRLGEARGTLALLQMIDGDDAMKAMLALSEVTGEPPTSSPSFWRAWWKTHAERYRPR
jgi:HEAT repeat protein